MSIITCYGKGREESLRQGMLQVHINPNLELYQHMMKSWRIQPWN